MYVIMHLDLMSKANNNCSPPHNTIQRVARLVHDSDPNKTSINTKDERQIPPLPVDNNAVRRTKAMQD